MCLTARDSGVRGLTQLTPDFKSISNRKTKKSETQTWMTMPKMLTKENLTGLRFNNFTLFSPFGFELMMKSKENKCKGVRINNFASYIFLVLSKVGNLNNFNTPQTCRLCIDCLHYILDSCTYKPYFCSFKD